MKGNLLTGAVVSIQSFGSRINAHTHMHIGEPADPPPSAPARAPPQTELSFGAPAQADTDRDTADWGDAVDAMPDWDSHSAD